MMAQVLVAAWVGITAGWLGFGWALAEAPAGEAQVALAAEVPLQVANDGASFDLIAARAVAMTEPKTRG